LEKLAALHRVKAEHAGTDWVWEARLSTAEDLERQAGKIRIQLSDDRETARSAIEPQTVGNKRRNHSLR
jgi:hypothetical protein